jgi:hypothetical protein
LIILRFVLTFIQDGKRRREMKLVFKSICLAGMLFFGSSPAFSADACTELVSRAELGLAQQGIDDGSKSQLEMLLEVGRSGDVSACVQATTGSLSSPRPTGHKCEKSLNSV